jgi:hypothetical protein
MVAFFALGASRHTEVIIGGSKKDPNMKRFMHRLNRASQARQVGTSKAILIIGLIAFGIIFWLSQGSSISSGSATPIHIDTSQTGFSIPGTFLGFSSDWGEAQAMMGTPSTGTNPIYRRLLKNLFQYGGGPVVVRIGGNSTDSVESNSQPDPGEIRAFSQLYRDTGAQFYLSVNLGAGNLGLAIRQAQFFVDNMLSGSLKAIEIGNEPDLYTSNGLRPPSFSFNGYLREFGAWQSALQQVLPSGLKFMGPSWSSPASLRDLPKFLNVESANLTVVSQHWYAGDACGGKKNPPDTLLNPAAAASGAQMVASSVELAHAKGLFFRIGEMNSISCNGEAGVTDTFASALWMIDSLFEFARVGVDGVNVHMDTDDAYGPFLFNVDTSTIPYRYSVKIIRPEYYGLFFFQQAAPGGSKLIHTDARGPANLRCWATVDHQGTIRITIVNEDERAVRNATVVGIKGYGKGALVRLLAPSYRAKTGITFGGLSFDGSEDGRAHGMPSGETISPRDGVYDIQVPPTSAALLTLKHA